MTEKLLKKYMQTFIKNLEYEEDGGRSAAIDVLVKLAEILPLDLLAPYYDLVVFACLARIVNEENLEFKANLRKVILTLFMRIEEDKLAHFGKTFLTWIEDSKIGVFQSGLEGFLLLAKRKFGIEKHVKAVLGHINRNMEFIASKLDLHWKQEFDDKQQHKEEQKANSSFLKKIKEENQSKSKLDVTIYESITLTIASSITVLSENYRELFTSYIKKDNPKFYSIYISLLSFPQEKLVTEIVNGFLSLVQNGQSFFESLGAEKTYEEYTFKILNLFRFNFSSDEFGNGLSALLTQVQKFIPKQEKVDYLLKTLTQIQKILHKQMASANLNSHRIKRIVSYINKVCSSDQNELTGELLTKYVEFLVRIENIKDMFTGENDISNIYEEVTK